MQLRERPKRDREATRRRLLEAATRLFGEHGYDQVSVRMIATAADANVALVNRYFGSKAELFGEVLASESTVRRVIEGDPAGLARRLADHVVRQVHADPSGPAIRALDRSVGCEDIQAILQRHVTKLIVEPIAAQLDGPDALVRARLATSVLLGTGSVRRLLGLTGLQTTDPRALADRITAVFEACLR